MRFDPNGNGVREREKETENVHWDRSIASCRGGRRRNDDDGVGGGLGGWGDVGAAAGAVRFLRRDEQEQQRRVEELVQHRRLADDGGWPAQYLLQWCKWYLLNVLRRYMQRTEWQHHSIGP